MNLQLDPAIWASHRAVARYRIVLSEPRRRRGQPHPIVAVGLTWDESQAECVRLTAAHEAGEAGSTEGFSRAIYLVELENEAACGELHAREAIKD